MTVLQLNPTPVKTVQELRVLVEGRKRYYFNGVEFERAYNYLKRVHAIRKVRNTLKWTENMLTPANLDFLEGRRHKPDVK